MKNTAVRIEPDPTRSSSYADLGSAEMIRGDRDKAEAAFNKAIEADPKSARAQIALANFKWASKDYAGAEGSLKRALGLDPKNLVANQALSMLYIRTGRAPLAEPLLKTVAETVNSPTTKFALADYYLGMNKLDSAREVVTPMLSEGNTFVMASIRLANLEVAEKKYQEAHRLLDAALAKEPNNAVALTARGRLFLVEGNSVNALTALKAAADADARAIDPRLLLGQTYAARGQNREAIATYNDVLSKDAENAAARLGLAQVQINSGQPADAVPLLLKVVQQQPNNLAARLALFQGLMAVSDFPQASVQLAAMQQLSPNSAAVQTAAGNLAVAKNDDSGARAAYAKALAADPRSYQALAGLLNAEMQRKNFGGARALIEKQLAQMPNDPNSLLLAAQTYDLLGDKAEMEKALRKTVEADPASLQAYAMLGKMFYDSGRLDLARNELEKYVSTAPASVPGNTMLGTILDMQGKKEEAKARYSRALQVDPRAAVAANNLAWINSNTNGGNLDVALQLAQTAKAQLPNRHEVDDTLGWIYYKKGLYPQAIDSLRSSTTKAPNNPSYNYHLAAALIKSGGSKDEARKLLEKAVTAKQSFDGAEDAKKLLAELKGTT